MIVKALVWLMIGILVASLSSALVQDCDNCDTDHIKNKYCCQRTAEIWNVKANPQADPGKKICCDFTGDTRDTKETCDVGVLKEGIAELKKRLEEDKLECAGTIDCDGTCLHCSCPASYPTPNTGCDCCDCVACTCVCWI